MMAWPVATGFGDSVIVTVRSGRKGVGVRVAVGVLVGTTCARLGLEGWTDTARSETMPTATRAITKTMASRSWSLACLTLLGYPALSRPKAALSLDACSPVPAAATPSKLPLAHIP